MKSTRALESTSLILGLTIKGTGSMAKLRDWGPVLMLKATSILETSSTI